MTMIAAMMQSVTTQMVVLSVPVSKDSLGMEGPVQVLHDVTHILVFITSGTTQHLMYSIKHTIMPL